MQLGDDILLLAEGKTEKHWLPSKLIDVDGEGMCWVDIKVSPLATELGLADQKIRVPFHHLQEVRDSEETALAKFKTFLRKILQGNDNNFEITPEIMQQIREYRYNNCIVDELQSQALQEVLSELANQRAHALNKQYQSILDRQMNNVK